MKSYIFDARVLLNPMYKGRGIARYARSLIHAAYQPGDIVYFDEAQISSPEAVEFLKSGFIVSSDIPTTGNYVFLLCSLFENKLPFELGFYQLEENLDIHVVLYDLIPFLSQEDYLRGTGPQSRYYSCLHVLKNAEKVFCISEHTRRDAIDHLDLDPDKCINIFTGVDDSFFDDRRVSVEPRLNLPSQQPFILSVSGLHPSKNLGALVNAFADPASELFLEYDLRLVMPPSVTIDNILELLPVRRRRLLRGKIHVISDLTEDEMKWHYQNCALFAYVSRYEGFGLPPAEAIVNGACVLSSRESSLAEVVTSEKSELDPNAPADIAQKMWRIIDDPELQKQIKAENEAVLPRLRWSNVAKTLNSARPAAVDASKTDTDSLPIDIFTALPPHRSGVIEYTVNFLNSIAGKFKIRVFYPEGSQPIGLDPRIRSYPLSVASGIMGPADRRFFVLGNSDAFIDVFEFALKNKGNLWLHDARYSGLVFAKCFLKDKSNWDGVEQIAAFANRRGYQHIGGDPAKVAHEGALFVRPLFAQGKSKVIVHNSIAERYVQAEASGLMYAPSIMNLPLVGFDELPPSDRPTPMEEDTLKVLSLGFVSDGKMPDDIVEGCGLASSKRPIDLTFCGQVTDDTVQALQRRADQYPNLNVMFTGFQSMSIYRQTIRQSDIAVQLRRNYNGESSATILDLLAGGIQVVTNFVNYDAELFKLLTTIPTQSRDLTLQKAVADALLTPTRPNRDDIEALFAKRKPADIMAQMLS